MIREPLQFFYQAMWESEDLWCIFLKHDFINSAHEDFVVLLHNVMLCQHAASIFRGKETDW